MVLAANVVAGVVQIDSYQLYANPINGVLEGDSPYLSTEDLAAIHSELNFYGVDTDGKITLIPIDTPTGFALFALMDREFGGGDSGSDAFIGLVSTASSSLHMYINDVSQDDWTLVEPPFGSQTLGATFVWGSLDSGDGFAWSGLELGDFFSYTFTSIDGSAGLDPQPFQFVGWVDDGWSVLGTEGFKADGSQVFTGSVIPAPPAALVLTAFALNRRRRRVN